MKYTLYDGETALLASDERGDMTVYATPPWLWQFGAITIGNPPRLWLLTEGLEMVVEGRRAWRQKIPKNAIAKREMLNPTGKCCHG
ncbi:hypothetical protein LCGC14_0288600 [marine sediment metagenome]|uniref:Uncharacterized protein n=1 Tax=marine sediment metagenome TaxID=412755 RepID=A0A0F9WZA8_9ZZZZ